jgi:hypothetical protein
VVNVEVSIGDIITAYIDTMASVEWEGGMLRDEGTLCRRRKGGVIPTIN